MLWDNVLFAVNNELETVKYLLEKYQQVQNNEREKHEWKQE